MRFVLLSAVLLVAPIAVSAQALPDGAQLYQQRCAMCHETAMGGAPARTVISAKTHDSIIETLTSGVMKPQATGLKAEEIAALATYLALAKPALANPEAAATAQQSPKR